MERFREQVEADKRSPGSLDTYRKHLKNHVLPALAEVRLGEVTTPLLDRVIGKIATDAGGPTAKTCRSVISGIMGLAVRRGAVFANPVREVEQIETRSKQARALNDGEVAAWLAALRSDELAVRRDLPDLTVFMLSTGCPDR